MLVIVPLCALLSTDTLLDRLWRCLPLAPYIAGNSVATAK